MLYAVTEIAGFMIAATIVGILLGRITKRTKVAPPGESNQHETAVAKQAVRELEQERSSLLGRLGDAEERVKQLTAAAQAAPVAMSPGGEIAVLRRKLESSRAKITRLQQQLDERAPHPDGSGDRPPAPARNRPPDIGYSSSAGTLADTKITFEGDQ